MGKKTFLLLLDPPLSPFARFITLTLARKKRELALATSEERKGRTLVVVFMFFFPPLFFSSISLTCMCYTVHAYIGEETKPGKVMSNFSLSISLFSLRFQQVWESTKSFSFWKIGEMAIAIKEKSKRTILLRATLKYVQLYTQKRKHHFFYYVNR